LVDRFKLVVHRDSKEAPIYEMTVAGNGPKFIHSKAATLAEVQQTHPNAGNAVALGGAIVSPGAQPGEQMIFGVTMPAFSTLLSTLVGRPIRDKTGLTGRYDIIYQMDLSSQDSAGPATSPNDLSAQILSILRDQLGLQLKPAKGSVETLVIDHIEQPSEN
jgi:bla regulator protein BlaR1